MQICDFTRPQLEYLRTNCNFVGDERRLFDLRADGRTLDECCEAMNREMSSVKAISRKVKRKIDAVMAWKREHENG